MSSSTLLASLFAYKAWANEALYAAMQDLDGTEYPEQRHTAIRILNHIYTVDRIFVANLQGLKHDYTATNTPVTPDLADLHDAVRITDRWYQGYLTTLREDELEQPVEFIFTDGKPARMTRAEMLMHVITHGGYHRGAVGRIMAQLSVSPPRDTFTVFLHSTEPDRRNHD
ncbi:MAG: DinB family protein [Rhodocyclaceae bacterium]|jgi:uncharacterized damage-inducible protein DinB|nr:DinB family protein [Rhodocyclaceae bacterium]